MMPVPKSKIRYLTRKVNFQNIQRGPFLRRNRIKSFYRKLTRQYKKNSYPCLCGVLGGILIMTRLMGILPVSEVEKKGHVTACGFETKTFWVAYSFSIQLFYFVFVFIIYSLRFYMGPMHQLKSEWYVMTFGYLVTDFEIIITLFMGTLASKRMCENLRVLSKMQGSVGETRTFKKYLKMVVITCLIGFAFLILSHIHVAILRSKKSKITLLDSPFLVMVRGCMFFYTSVEVIIVFIFCFLITLKYKYLATMTSRTMENLYIQSGGKSYHSLIKYTDAIALTIAKSENIPKLNQLETFYQRLTTTVDEVNTTVGLSILVAVTSSLYSTMYYLYRFSTASDNGININTNERLHYVIGLFGKSGKMFGYMVMGNLLLKASRQPLEVLRNSRIVNLPNGIQQQVQSLMLQWFESKGYLSAGGIVRVGPWLLAPILGNVITYLLVALQFNQSLAEEYDI
ncbi:uncharacterized protein LOC123308215 [Coccinella septempunctata]|uniref:uncharacterized protein LOC123308215 n=1 Tax=Coccinella septempunctata TaxID=41139 RepID=UPI001D077117|nr:uncharacterized protein LOC123308215 [Coccinella septempunctata]